jgi:hypothetical protein
VNGYLVQQSSASYPLLFLLVSSSDHISPVTGATPTVTLSKNGAAFASPAGTVTEIANGWYKVAGNGTDTATLGPLALHATASGADPSDWLFTVVAFNPQSATNLGLSALPTANPAASGGLPTADASNGVKLSVGTGTGQVSVASGKVPATLASTDVTGNVAADVQTIKTQTVTCAAGVTVNVNVGTTQPVNFTGTSTSALVKSDTVDIAGAAVGTSTAQIGVNLVNIAGSAVSTSTAQLGVNVVNIKGTASAGAAGYVGPDWGAVANKTTTNALTGTTIGNVTVGGYATGQDPATLVLDVAISGHETAGSVGAAIAAAGGSGDPWATALPGSYTSGQAGYIIGHNVDTTQAIPTSNTAQTLGDCLNAARAQGFGKWTVVGTTLTLFASDGTTAVRTFTLDDAGAPTSRI